MFIKESRRSTGPNDGGMSTTLYVPVDKSNFLAIMLVEYDEVKEGEPARTLVFETGQVIEIKDLLAKTKFIKGVEHMQGRSEVLKKVPYQIVITDPETIDKFVNYADQQCL